VEGRHESRGRSKTTAEEAVGLEETIGQTKPEGKIIKKEEERSYIDEGEECR
jgi:hypothetical protein